MLTTENEASVLSIRSATQAYVLVRWILGVNILVHGLTRLLAGPGEFAALLVQGFHATPLPPAWITAFAHTLPWLEFLLGGLVLLGLFTRQAMLAGLLLILVLTFGSTLRQDWESAGLQLIYAAVYGVLLALIPLNRCALDRCFKHDALQKEEK